MLLGAGLFFAGLALVHCGPGKAATGSMTLNLTVNRPDPFKVGDATLTLSKAWLHIEAVEVLGGENVTQHSHDEKDHDKGTSQSGALKVTAPHQLLDLLQPTTSLAQVDSATAGEYTLIAISLSNAEEGDPKGYALWLEGTVEKGTDKRTFAVKWSTDKTLNDFAEFKGDIDLASGGSVTLTLAADLGELFSGVDLFAAQANGDSVTVDKDNNATLLSTFAGNLKKVFSLKK